MAALLLQSSCQATHGSTVEEWRVPGLPRCLVQGGPSGCAEAVAVAAKCSQPAAHELQHGWRRGGQETGPRSGGTSFANAAEAELAQTLLQGALSLPACCVMLQPEDDTHTMCARLKLHDSAGCCVGWTPSAAGAPTHFADQSCLRD